MKPLLVVNPSAAGSRTGRAFADTAAVVERALGAVDAVFTERHGHAIELARAGAEAGRELVVAVGGDGTLSEVVNGVMQAGGPACVGFIPQGTGGDFRRSLGRGHGLQESLTALASGGERRIDLGRLAYTDFDGATRDRYFINIVSAGLGGLVDRYVVAMPAWVGGRLGYYAAALRAFAVCPQARLRCRFTRDGQTQERELRARVIAVCNGAYFGSGMYMAPMALVDDGRLEVVAVAQPTWLHMVLRSRRIYDGSHLAIRGVEHFACQRIDLDVVDEKVRRRHLLDVDGDALGRLPLSIEVLPGALALRG